MPWFKRGSYNFNKARSYNENSSTDKKKTDPVLKRDGRLRSTLTYRFQSYSKNKILKMPRTKKKKVISKFSKLKRWNVHRN